MSEIGHLQLKITHIASHNYFVLCYYTYICGNKKSTIVERKLNLSYLTIKKSFFFGISYHQYESTATWNNTFCFFRIQCGFENRMNVHETKCINNTYNTFSIIHYYYSTMLRFFLLISFLEIVWTVKWRSILSWNYGFFFWQRQLIKAHLKACLQNKKKFYT